MLKNDVTTISPSHRSTNANVRSFKGEGSSVKQWCKHENPFNLQTGQYMWTAMTIRSATHQQLRWCITCHQSPLAGVRHGWVQHTHTSDGRQGQTTLLFQILSGGNRTYYSGMELDLKCPPGACAYGKWCNTAYVVKQALEFALWKPDIIRRGREIVPCWNINGIVSPD